MSKSDNELVCEVAFYIVAAILITLVVILFIGD